LFLTLLLATIVAQLARIQWGAPGGIIVGAWYAAAAIANLGWTPPIDHHADARAGTREVVSSIWLAGAAVPPGGTVHIEKRHFVPGPFAPTLFPGWAAVFVIFFPDNVVDGRRVYFVERNPAVLAELCPGRRTTSLLVAP